MLHFIRVREYKQIYIENVNKHGIISNQYFPSKYSNIYYGIPLIHSCM